MSARKPQLAEVLGPCLRSGVDRFVKAAQQEIKQRTKGLETEGECASALGISERVWYNWLSDGLVQRRSRGPGRLPRSA